MVSSQLPALSKITSVQSSHLVFPVNLPSDDVEMDFSDVFGPLPVQASTGVSNVMELVAEADPVDDYNLQTHHSLVSPSARVSPCSMISKLAIHDTEGSRELVAEIGTDETVKQVGKLLVTDDDNVEESPDVNSMKIQSVGVEDFEVIKVVGQGAFGKVLQVRKKGTSEIYAMKVMQKDKIVKNNHAEYMKAERDILAKIRHPFIVALRYSFQTKYRLYLVLDFVNGGHLLFHLYNNGLFKEDLARIYTAEIVSAVSYLHANGIMHRDLKPENILLDADGHAMLTDFGLAEQFEENARSNSMCGTVEYMSPEIVSRKGHDKAADWWSVGILLFEMLTGKLPFTSANREKTQRKIMKDKIKLPGFLTSEAHSLLKGLLQKDPSNRLGSGPCGSDEVKSHKWFKTINWKKLEAREIQPSFRPEVAGKHCVAYFDKHWTDMPLQDSPASSPKTDIDPFQGFAYERPDPACSFIS